VCHRVFGGPWSYDGEPTGKPGPVEQEVGLCRRSNGGAVAGLNMYEAAGHWDDTNAWGVPCCSVTHRNPRKSSPAATTSCSLTGPRRRSRGQAGSGDKDVSLHGCRLMGSPLLEPMLETFWESAIL
jgi:hypothetical protein